MRALLVCLGVLLCPPLAVRPLTAAFAGTRLRGVPFWGESQLQSLVVMAESDVRATLPEGLPVLSARIVVPKIFYHLVEP